MSKQINIGGRIHSTEVGNVVVGANEVLDDTKGKKQNVINSETDAELLRLDQSKQNNLTFDNTPTENSTNPVTSGGVYAANITLHELIEAILVLIPSAASALNQLADKAFVNSSVSTATAMFRGTYNVVTDLELAYDATHEQIATKLGQVIATADNNDYAFVQVPVSATSTDIRRTERYKFNGTVWGYEYDLNTSGFTAAQWEAINSGITALLVSKLTNLPTAEVLATMFNAKQNVLTFDAEPTALSTNPVYSGGVYAAIKAITDLIPSEATALNQLADKAYVLAAILAATPAFKGQFTSLVDLQAVSSPKAGDLGIVRTKDNDGKDVFTFYQYLSNAWNVYFSLSYHPQTKPATTGTTGDYPYNGMGRVELPMNIVEGVNTLTQSMMPTATGGNTIYVIKYDFTLGENITVPDNCVLEFDGGSIIGAVNCTLTMNGCYLKGLPKFNNVVFAGDIRNDMFDCTWIDNGTDIGSKINYAQTYFKRLFVPGGEYLLSTPVVVSNIKRLDCRATLKFNGTYKNCEGIFIIKDSLEGVFNFNCLQPNDASVIDRTNSRTLNTVGLEIRSCNDNSFVIQNVGWFNENIRISDIEGRGCCYNTFRIIHVNNGNANVRIYQHDKEGGGASWCNENTFNGGRYAHYTNTYSYGNKYDFVIGGPALDSDTYLPSGITDSYDGINCITIQDCSMEKPWTPILARNVDYLSLLRIDGEANPSPAKFVGSCTDITQQVKYGPNIFKSDLSDATAFDTRNQLPYKMSVTINDKITADNKICPFDFDISDANGIVNTPNRSSYDDVGFIVDTSVNKIFKITFDKPARHAIRYLDNSNNNITNNNQDKKPLGPGFYYRGGDKDFIGSSNTMSALIVIPNGISKALIGAVLNSYPNEIIIESVGAFSKKVTKIQGTTSDRPVCGLPANMSYYDTTINKLIWYNGNGTTGWCDATGASV